MLKVNQASIQRIGMHHKVYLCYNMGDEVILMNYEKRRNVFFYLLLLMLLITIALTIIIWIQSWDFSTKLLVYFLIIIVIAIGSLLLKSYMLFYTRQMHIEKMIETVVPYTSCAYDVFDSDFFIRLQRKGFEIGKNAQQVQVMYRYEKDNDNRFYRYGALEIILLLKDSSIGPTDQRLIKFVNEVEDLHVKQKKYIQKYYIYTFKQTPHMEQSLMSELTQIQFEREQKRQITSIHVYQDKSSQLLYFLHSKTYQPNAYYQFATERIYELIDR